MEILAIIPARSGSKGVANKNVLTIAGKPMLAYPIEDALRSKLITRVIVSTDSEGYMEIARRHGAETPFKRPAQYAGDDSPDIDVFYHALEWLRDNEGYLPDICVQLRPCGPVRDPLLLDLIIQRLIDNPRWDSVRTVARSSEIPYKMWHISSDGTLSPVIKDMPECYNMPRQKLPATFFQNGYLDAVRARVVLEERSMTGNAIGAFVIDEYFDVDYPEDIDLVEACLDIRNNKRSFQIDPRYAGIETAQRLRDVGHTVEIKGDRDCIKADYCVCPKNVGIVELAKIINNNGC